MNQRSSTNRLPIQIKVIYNKQKVTEPFIFGGVFKKAIKSVEKGVKGPIEQIKNLGIKIGKVFTSIGGVYAGQINLIVKMYTAILQ